MIKIGLLGLKSCSRLSRLSMNDASLSIGGLYAQMNAMSSDRVVMENEMNSMSAIVELVRMLETECLR